MVVFCKDKLIFGTRLEKNDIDIQKMANKFAAADSLIKKVLIFAD